MKFAVALVVASCVAYGSAQSYQLLSSADGNAPDHQSDHKLISGLADWDAAGRTISTYARADAHNWDPPHSESFSEATFSQLDPANAFLRLSALARMPYRGSEANKVSGETDALFIYTLVVENTSSNPLNIVLGNRVHGVMGCVESGMVDVEERVLIDGQEVAFGSFLLDKHGFFGTGIWEHAGSSATVSDVFYDTSQITGAQLNSFEFYKTYLFAPQEKRTFSMYFDFDVRAEIPGGSTSLNGLAMADFSQTVNPTVKASDPDTGADRTGDIRVGLVPEPSSWLATGLGFAALAIRRWRR